MGSPTRFSLVFIILALLEAVILQNPTDFRSVKSNFSVKELCAKKTNEKAYAFIPIKVNWFEAFAFCARNKMRLLTINSHVETIDLGKQLRIEKEVEDEYWTSGTKYGSRTVSDFIWFTDGSPFIYTNWYESTNSRYNQPNNLNGNEKCLVLSNWNMTEYWYKWHDVPCERNFAFICESDCNNI
ncbi:C-type lectin mannose-binding isoform-like [Anthonomus grandis grandis]|uniref:C-type lectin mannose-binding isoform-like n=1 Tax=Anthonomus grandis grandis TaxID=2921223 RepID=UPI0021651DAF|nr:C-type lectin mannose-binding isoform-like [Anthonomus grandis grandis]